MKYPGVTYFDTMYVWKQKYECAKTRTKDTWYIDYNSFKAKISLVFCPKIGWILQIRTRTPYPLTIWARRVSLLFRRASARDYTMLEKKIYWASVVRVQKGSQSASYFSQTTSSPIIITQLLLRWSACVLVCFAWLLNNVIYLKLRRE